MNPFMAVVNKSLMFSRSWCGPNGTVNKPKTIGQWGSPGCHSINASLCCHESYKYSQSCDWWSCWELEQVQRTYESCHHISMGMKVASSQLIVSGICKTSFRIRISRFPKWNSANLSDLSSSSRSKGAYESYGKSRFSMHRGRTEQQIRHHW